MVTREQFLAALKTVSVRPVTVAGQAVFVRGVWGDERTMLIDRARAGNPLQAKELVAMCVCDEAGDAFLLPEDIEVLAKRDSGCLEKLGAEILSASGLMPDAEAEAAKN